MKFISASALILVGSAMKQAQRLDEAEARFESSRVKKARQAKDAVMRAMTQSLKNAYLGDILEDPNSEKVGKLICEYADIYDGVVIIADREDMQELIEGARRVASQSPDGEIDLREMIRNCPRNRRHVLSNYQQFSNVVGCYERIRANHYSAEKKQDLKFLKNRGYKHDTTKCYYKLRPVNPKKGQNVYKVYIIYTNGAWKHLRICVEGKYVKESPVVTRLTADCLDTNNSPRLSLITLGAHQRQGKDGYMTIDNVAKMVGSRTYPKREE